MNSKQKIELAVFSGLFLVLLSSIFWVYQSRTSDAELSRSPEEIMYDRLTWSKANDYRLQTGSFGTEIQHRPTRFSMILPDNWSAKIVSLGNESDNVRIDARLEGSSFDLNGVVRQGCSIDIRFVQAPLRWQSARETIEILEKEAAEGLWKRQVAFVGPAQALNQTYTAESGRHFIDILAPLEDHYLLDITAIFSEKHQQGCRQQFYQSLIAAQIN